MRRLGALFILFIALAGVLSPFDAKPYLYDGETMQMVSEVPIEIEGGSYTLVRINNADTFLLSNGEPLTDAAAISSVIRENEISTLMPGDSEWAAIKAKLISFNSSRNYKTRFGPAEDLCVQATLLKYYPCNTYASCFVTANQICNLAASGGSSGCVPDMLATPILNYSQSIITLNSEMGGALKLQSSLTPENAATTFSTLLLKIKNMKSAATSISKNILRFPDTGDKCPEGGISGCIGICPSSKFDFASLDNATSLVMKFQDRTAPLEAVSSLASQIAQATSDRLRYKETTALAAQWGPKWKAFKAKHEPLRVKASSLVPFIADASFTGAYSAFNTKWSDMDRKLATRDFNGIAQSFSAAEIAATMLNASLTAGVQPYNATLKAQNSASDILIRARWKVNAKLSSSVSLYNSLATRKNSLDSQFKPPMAQAKYAALSGNYTKLAADAQKFMDGQQKVADTAANVGGKFGAASVNGVFTLAAAFTPLSYSTRSSFAPVIPPVVLFLSDLAVVSVAIVLFVGVLVYFKGVFHNKVFLGLWVLAFLAFLFATAVSSVAIFAFVNSAASGGTYDEFLPKLASAPTAYIAIDQAGATPAQVAAMSSCANLISSQVKSQFGKQSEAFTYSGTACAWLSKNGTGQNTSLTRDACFDRSVGSAVFVLHPSSQASEPKFSTVYAKQADIYGDEAYYRRCEIGDVLG